MMRKLYYFSTFVFWFAVLAFWAGNSMLPVEEEGVVVAADNTISPADLARHDQPQDCWMAIRGSVYDISSYVLQHPSPPEIILPWCGKEATVAYETKTRGRPHSSYADGLLPGYRIGVIGKAP
jgi:cytochrome b involved in lipid metabolism